MTFPGIVPVTIFSGAEQLITVSQVNSVTNTGSPSVILPSDIRPGDLLVCWNRASDDPPPSTALPSGFTQIGNVAATFFRGIMSYKRADGDEDNEELFGMNAVVNLMAVYVFRGNVPILSVTPTDVESELTDGNPTSKTVNASGNTKPLIVLGGFGSTGPVNPRTFSPAKDGEIEALDAKFGEDAWLAYKIYNSSPADVAIDMDDEGGGNTLMTCYLLLE